ncbi:MAG: hypothetical protein HC812_14280 [Leptolyngbya sp. RL_3_1]|nr:hypothetical protein [Leptolyngbya sp. RL_3_1]
MGVINPIQGLFSCQLSLLADAVITNTADFKRFLSIWSSKIYSIPNFSTIGEPQYIPTLQERNRDLVVFGSSDRNRVYQSGITDLIKLCGRLEIKRILDIGQINPTDLSQLEEKVQVVRMGPQPAAVVSQIMTDSVAGLFDYGRFPRHLGKSSVYAAYCAHGLLPIGNDYYPSEADHVFNNKHYLVLSKMAHDTATPDWSLYQTVAHAAHDWYGNHTIAKCANLFKECIEK